jgi:hypothetical protein
MKIEMDIQKFQNSARELWVYYEDKEFIVPFLPRALGKLGKICSLKSQSIFFLLSPLLVNILCSFREGVSCSIKGNLEGFEFGGS